MNKFRHWYWYRVNKGFRPRSQPLSPLHPSTTHTMVLLTESPKKMARISNTTFIHFNDIYNADKAAPFVSSTKNCRRDLQSSSSEEVDDGHRRRRDVFTFFSGDVFSPSILSTFFRGEQMLPVLNALDIDCACLGMYI